ncbi:MAG TPA: J domain-containing protein [Thermoplasmata archaeon]|nr:J domain-containing protein [Thermoplasmata archaeon]
MAKRDYYEVLGLAKTASPEEIKQAYRRLARQYHPDVAKENPKAAEEKFKELSEAYEVLADPEKRRRYDAQGFGAVESDFGPGGFTWQNFTHAGDLEDLLGSSALFQQLFGSFGSPFGGMRGVPSNRGSDIEVAVRLPLAAAVDGAQPTIEIPKIGPCPDCRGTGARGGTALETCPECGGSGQVRRVRRSGYTQLITVGECPKCHGSGRRILEKCPTCGGSGRQRSVERLEVTVPAGIEDGAVLRIPGHGGGGFDGGRAGDLFVQVLFEPADHLRREGLDAYTETTVPLAVAIFGGEVTIPTIEGQAVLTIPAGTQPEAQLRMRGRGFPRFRGGGRGDIYVTVHVEIPRSLSSHQREALREALGDGGTAPGGRREGFFRRHGSGR